MWHQMILANNLTSDALQEARSANETSSRLTQEGLRLTQESNELAQRSWVLLEGVDKIELVADQPCELYVRFKNFGKTPATILNSGAQSEVASQFPGKPTYPIKSAPAPGIGAIGPEQVHSMKLTCGPLPAPIVSAINDDRVRLYIHGLLNILTSSDAIAG